MKASMILSFIGLLSTTAVASNLAALKAECGSLGVMKLTQEQMQNVPDVSAIRHCAEHPLGPTAGPDFRERDITAIKPRDGGLVDLHARECWYGEKTIGCSRGYCWRNCDPENPGYWCWTAANDGLGDWLTCQADADCNDTDACGVGNCAACGCSC
jgi:hypothetical protein